MKKERNLFLDITKAICIIFVIVGHCIQYGSGSAYSQAQTYFENPVFIFIYSFHMPLFMLISGYLFAFSTKSKKWNELLFIKMKQLIIPLGVWSVVTLLIEIIKVMTNTTAASINIIWIAKKLITGFIYGPWFLWAIWWCSLIVVIVRRFFNDNIFIYIAGTLVTFILPDTFNLAVYKYMWPFFLLAYLFNAKGYKEKLKKFYMNKIFILCCFFAFALLLIFYNYDSYIYTSGYTVLNRDILKQVCIDVYRFFIGLVGSISVMYLIYWAVKILPDKIKNVFAYIGMNTLGIYIISNILFTEILQNITSALTGINYFYIFLGSVFILCTSILITAILKRFKITNALFLGGR